ncbi:hypothetical protein DNH61_25910 [Paenibacillus sambharensis]|uniref:Uncharacterized protein n=1 Tax=Paenibacillus sambharensis TaxID=1803190 RepID=A0A2W1L430_9BACL|nr:hypothetical protein [Paenibacillus sambharensis]PZD92930.1 hypothetical protein DNH61_25910 [Paenibacillus sambharensis]
MEQHLITRPQDQHRPAGGKPKGTIIALAVLLIAAAAAVWMNRQPGEEGLASVTPGMESILSEDAARLWRWADDELAGGSEKAGWSARWDSSLTAEESAELIKELELTPTSDEKAEHAGPLHRVVLWREAGTGLPEGAEESSTAEIDTAERSAAKSSASEKGGPARVSAAKSSTAWIGTAERSAVERTSMESITAAVKTADISPAEVNSAERSPSAASTTVVSTLEVSAAEAGWSSDTGTEAGMPESRSVLLFEGSPGLPRSEFLQQISIIDGLLDASAARSLTFRGEARTAESYERIAEAADAIRVESYDGGGTASDVYFTSGLKLFTYSGENKVNLQLASHWDSTAGRWQLTGGVPLITGDYSRVP